MTPRKRQAWRSLLDDLGLETLRYSFSQWTSQIELQAGDPAAAVADLVRARDGLERLGERAYRSTCTALLADALYADGRTRDAEQMADVAEAESATEDAVNFAIADGMRARAAADRGDFETAGRLAERAVGLAFRMDMPKPRADALCVHTCSGRAAGVPRLPGCSIGPSRCTSARASGRRRTAPVSCSRPYRPPSSR